MCLTLQHCWNYQFKVQDMMTDEIKLPLTSADVTEELLAQLRVAAPQIFSEGRVDFSKLQAALGEHIETNPERYGLTWAGKRDAFRNVQVPSVATLRPQPEESVNWDSTENLIIEGDNLEVLKLLQKSYHSKVKMIYIDPPYNTGNEFIYPDNFREGLDDYLRYTQQLSEEGTATSTNKDTSGRYHSNWLNMMYPRLFLARNLLREDGVIFVSIDDHEVHNLRMLMDEVFGEENFVGDFVWKRRASSALAERLVSTDHEYVITYQKASFTSLGVAKDFENYSNPDGDPRGDWTAGDLTVGMNKDQRPNQFYELINPDTGISYPPNPNRVWAYIPSSMSKLVEERRVIFPANASKRPMLKRYKNELRSEVNPASTWLASVGLNSEATRQIQALLGSGVFSYPKPTTLVQELVAISTNEEDIILDFFAGSGTTAHAVIDLNQQDGGNRKFILVQLPEKTDNPQYPTIAHITRERVRRVIAKLKNDKRGQLALEGETKHDRGFRAFKLDSSNFKIWQPDNVPQSAEQLAEQLSLYADNVQANRDDQDRLYELILKSGRPLSARIESVDVGGRTAFAVGDGDLLICLEQHLDRDTLRALFARKPRIVLCLDTAFDGNDALKTNTVLEAQSHGIIFKTV
jgi:adenine-specific DNA-methyltransferase